VSSSNTTQPKITTKLKPKKLVSTPKPQQTQSSVVTTPIQYYPQPTQYYPQPTHYYPQSYHQPTQYYPETTQSYHQPTQYYPQPTQYYPQPQQYIAPQPDSTQSTADLFNMLNTLTPMQMSDQTGRGRRKKVGSALSLQ
jgi:hypothetical protein